MAPRLVVSEVEYDLDNNGAPLLRNLTLDTCGYGRVGLVGPSGIGKTTLFEILAGRREPARGTITVDGRPHEESAIGFCYQDRRLAPWLSVRANIEFGLFQGRDQALVDEMIVRLRLERCADTLASLVSGGEQARCAIGRALVSEPDLLLLDEPLTGLDRGVRERVITDLVALQAERGFLLLLISHELDDIEAICEQVHVMHGTPAEVVRTVQLDESLSADERATAIDMISKTLAS